MTPWVYEDTPPPKAKWGLANGENAVMIDMPDGGDWENDGEPGTEDWDGPSAILQGGKAHAIEWLKAALASVEALPDEAPA